MADLTALFQSCCASIDAELQIIAKLIKRNKSQHRSTQVFRLLMQVQRIYSLIPLSDVALLIESIQSTTKSMHSQKPTADNVGKIFSLCKDNAKSIQWSCELAEFSAKTGRLLIISITQKLFLPLYCTFLASCSRILKSISKICIHLFNQFESLLSYLKGMTSVNDRFEHLIRKEMISWSCLKCHCLTHAVSTVCSGLICSKYIHLIDILKRAESSSTSDATYASLQSSLSLNFGANKSQRVQMGRKNAASGNFSLNSAPTASSDGTIAFVASVSGSSSSATAFASMSKASSSDNVPSFYADVDDGDVGYVVAVLEAQDAKTSQADGRNKIIFEPEPGQVKSLGKLNDFSVIKSSDGSSHSSSSSGMDNESRLLINDMFDDSEGTSLTSALASVSGATSVLKATSGSKKRKFSSKSLFHLAGTEGRKSSDIDDIFSGF